jgi:uncharacterized repeat protein (TIGR03803 family)
VLVFTQKRRIHMDRKELASQGIRALMVLGTVALGLLGFGRSTAAFAAQRMHTAGPVQTWTRTGTKAQVVKEYGKLPLAAAQTAASEVQPRQADNEQVLYNFDFHTANVTSGVIRDGNGNLYGTGYGGGPDDLGTVFRVTPDGTFTALYNFTSDPEDGNSPASGVARDSVGNLYGITQYGGGGYGYCPYGCGIIFKVAPDGTETVLYRFTGPDGAFGFGSYNNTPILDGQGNLYGTTFYGGRQGCNNGACGVVYKLTPTGTLTVLHVFTGGSDGGHPTGPLIADSNGNLYGTTAVGGNFGCGEGYGCGVIFEVASDGTFSVLHSFRQSDGDLPVGPLVRDANGNLYGATGFGGDLSCDPYGDGCGVVFKLAPDGTLTVLHQFTGSLGDAPGGDVPSDGLIADPAGNLYGMTEGGGILDCQDEGDPGCGVAFKISPDGTETVLYSFDNNAGGSFPREGPLVIDNSGNLYGTTWWSGAYGLGTLFSLSTGPAVSLNPSALSFGPQPVQAPNVPQVVTLTNTGQAPLSITSIAITGQSSGDFQQSNNCPTSPNTLGAGNNCSITVVFAPQEPGMLQADVTITDDAPDSPQNVPLTGIGVSGKPRPKR